MREHECKGSAESNSVVQQLVLSVINELLLFIETGSPILSSICHKGRVCSLVSSRLLSLRPYSMYIIILVQWYTMTYYCSFSSVISFTSGISASFSFSCFFAFFPSFFCVMSSSSCSFATCILHTAHSVSLSCAFVCCLWLYGLLFVLMIAVLQLSVHARCWPFVGQQRPAFPRCPVCFIHDNVTLVTSLSP